MRVVFDANIWISYVIGKRLGNFRELLLDPELHIFTCDELIIEFIEVSTRPVLQKYIDPKRLDPIFEQLWNYTNKVSISKPLSIAIDPKDDYLLQLCLENNIEYLITGDKYLLDLIKYHQTKIISYTDFIKLKFGLR